MDLSQLKTIGLTDGEIAVYSALIELGQTSTGRLMKKADISSSKIYLILEKLTNKGLVSICMVDGVRHFQTTDPKAILEFIETKKDELERTNQEIKKILPHINSMRNPHIEDTAQVYKGFKGMKAAYMNILEELQAGEEYCIFAMSGDDIDDARIQAFFIAFHKLRIERKIQLRIIVHSDSYEAYRKKNLAVGHCEIRHHPFALPVSMAIGKHRLTSMMFHPEIIVNELVSDAMTREYKKFFERIWSVAKAETKHVRRT